VTRVRAASGSVVAAGGGDPSAARYLAEGLSAAEAARPVRLHLRVVAVGGADIRAGVLRLAVRQGHDTRRRPGCRYRTGGAFVRGEQVCL